jgi:predicted ATP-dependent serine protease
VFACCRCTLQATAWHGKSISCDQPIQIINEAKATDPNDVIPKESSSKKTFMTVVSIH